MIKNRGGAGLTSPNSPTNTTNPSGGVVAEGVSFDGSTDYLSRSSDLVGNTDSKTFTLSLYAYIPSDEDDGYILSTKNFRFNLYLFANKTIRIQGKNSVGTTILSGVTDNPVHIDTFLNVLVSVDLSSALNRKIIINDIEYSMTYSTYVNDTIDFTDDSDGMSIGFLGGNYFKGRLSNVFLDYTYRDLSIEANRRLFIDADGKPVDGLELVDKYFANSAFLVTGAPTPVGVAYDNTGTVMYITSYTNQAIYKYTLSAPYMPVTATYIGLSLQLSVPTFEIKFSPDGSSLFISTYTNDKILQYSMSTPFDVSTAVDTGKFITSLTCLGFDISPNGLYACAINYSTGLVSSYILNTAWDFSSVTVSGTSTITTNKSNYGLALSDTSIFFTYSDAIVEYALTTPYNITATTYIGASPLITTSATGYAIAFHDNGNNVALTDNLGNTNSFSLSNSYDIVSSLSEYIEPANTPAAPILYLPMTDATTAHINLGTGGDFVQNGTLTTADRGANQDNCAASKFNGNGNYLNKGVVSSSGKVLSFSCIFTPSQTTNQEEIFGTFNGNSDTFPIRFRQSFSEFRIEIASTTTSTAVFITVSIPLIENKMNLISFCIDTSLQSNCKVFINGVEDTSKVFDVFSLDAILPTSNNNIFVGAYVTTSIQPLTGSIGELYFDNNYIDLATNNPFWDADNNRPKPVRQVLRETGANPLVAMPISADYPELNLGSAGNFTKVGTGFTGARGASEYISRSMTTAGSALVDNLINTNLIGATSSNKLTIVVATKFTTAGIGTAMSFKLNTTEHLRFDFGTDGFIIELKPVSGSPYRTLSTSSDAGVNSTNTWHVGMISVDVSSTSLRKAYIDGTLRPDSIFGGDYVDGLFEWGSLNNNSIFNHAAGVEGSMLYLSNEYVDLTDETIRNTFVNQLGYPRDLTPEIEAGNIPTPLIYMKFDDPSNLGKNDGTGGDFTVNGTVTAGADFTL